MTGLLAAMAFLTRIPVPAFVHTRTGALENAGRWFPVVGLLLGSLYTAAAWAANGHLPGTVTAVLLVGFDALLTGGLHLDGLADMADGFGGGKTREDILRIMRDHAVGSYGAVALIVILLLKTVCLSELVTSSRNLWILFTAPTLSRWSILLLARSAPYARKTDDGPTGSGALSRSFTGLDLVIGTVVCFALLPLAGVTRTLACWLVTAASTACLVALARRRIGGITGDVLGANVVLAEALQLMTALYFVAGSEG